MNIALICPSNIIHMPYVSNYIDILNKCSNVTFVLINWDRFGIEPDSEYCFKDNKKSHSRSFFEYYKYSKFIKKILKSNCYDGVIVFGLQLAFFLSGVLANKYDSRYIVDIRDYNKIKLLSTFESVIKKSAFTVISSPGYKAWLPVCNKYIVNHNAILEDLENLSNVKEYMTSNIKISCIGALKDFDINKELMKNLFEDRYYLIYAGEGVINNELLEYINVNGINNVCISGRYKKCDEAGLYHEADFINMLMSQNSINNNTCLSNRLYNAAIFGRPLIALQGSLIANVIQEYNLGIVISSFSELKEKIEQFIVDYNCIKFDSARKKFLMDVINENVLFKNQLISFVSKTS